MLATEKKMSTQLMDGSSVQKISALDEHVGLVYSGMGPDARVLVNSGRKECQIYRRMYREPIPVGQLVRHVANVMQEFTQSGGVRPFGISLLVAGYDSTGPHLFQVPAVPCCVTPHEAAGIEVVGAALRLKGWLQPPPPPPTDPPPRGTVRGFRWPNLPRERKDVQEGEERPGRGREGTRW